MSLRTEDQVEKLSKDEITKLSLGYLGKIMALDRVIRCGNDTSESVYDDRG